MKKVFSLLLAVMILFAMALPASAASLTINRRDSFTISPGIANAYDLFDEQFKGIMPGDSIEAEITIKSGFRLNEDTLDVYMRAVPHSDSDNTPITPGTGSVAYMNDFLEKLTLRVYNESRGGRMIFEGRADELDGLKENVFLGSFRKGGKIVLRVELYWPAGENYDYNQYANRVGEVDWLFTVEAYDDPSYDNPKTGDYIMIAVAVMAVSGIALAAVLVAKRKKKK